MGGAKSAPNAASGDGRGSTGWPLWRWCSWILPLLLLLVIGLTFRDYGITWDEEAQSAYGRRLLRWYASFSKDDSALRFGNLFYYGGLFEILAELAAKLMPEAPYETRHLVNALTGLGAVVAVNRVGARLAGPLGGFLSALFLALTPVFFGHMFNNPKDIPFAAGCSVALWAMLASWDALPRLGPSRALAVGLASGAALGVRVAGVVLFIHLATLFGAWLFAHRRLGSAPLPWTAAVKSLAASFLKVVAVAWLVMLACWPWALQSPLRRPFEALTVLAHLTESAPMLFNGRYVYSGDLPWTYVPVWLGMSLPEFYPVAFLLGALTLPRLWLRGQLGRSALLRLLQAAWVGTVAALPLVMTATLRPFLYDGVRHLLFIVPVLAVLGGVSAAAFFQSRRGRWPELVVAALIVATLSGLTAWDMARLHPYQSIYFNRLVAGGVAAASQRFETDYWGSSYKEGVEWLVRHYGHGLARKVRVASTFVPLQCTYYLRRSAEGRRRFLYVSLDDNPHVVLSITRKHIHEHFQGRILHVVERQGARLLYIIETRRPLPAFVRPPRPGDPRLVPPVE